ncbi:MAG: hypothetical protein D3924_14175 [Candidatus Electrothrix sp. AR4]|nr:hypothetical protein [Candidatus Electrothrix sp. AR4]
MAVVLRKHKEFRVLLYGSRHLKRFQIAWGIVKYIKEICIVDAVLRGEFLSCMCGPKYGTDWVRYCLDGKGRKFSGRK